MVGANEEKKQEQEASHMKETTTTSLIHVLPDELMIGIISQLPPKPFFRCRSVCKYWLSLCSYAFQLNKHFQPTVSSLLYTNGSDDSIRFKSLSCGANMVNIADRTISALSRLSQIKVLDCCNGLLLLGASSKLKRPFVYNPATQTLFALECSKFVKKSSIYSLAFDLQAPSRLHLISFTYYTRKGIHTIHIGIFLFDRGKNKCKHQKKLVSDIILCLLSKNIFFDGRVHCLTSQKKIFSIDPNKCSYHVNPLPDNSGSQASVEIGHSHGLLHCLYTHYNKEMSIWVLKRSTRHEWSLKYHLSLQQIYSVPQPHYGLLDLFIILVWGIHAFHPQKVIVFLAPKDVFLSFDLSSGKIEEIDTAGDNTLFDCWFYMPSYSV